MSNNKLKAKLNELTKKFEIQAKSEYEKLYEIGKWKKYIREGTNQEDMEEEAYFDGMREYTFQRVAELTCRYINSSNDIALSKEEVLQYLEGLSAKERRKEDAAIVYADGIIEGLKQPVNSASGKDKNDSGKNNSEESDIGNSPKVENKNKNKSLKGKKVYIECNLKKLIKYDAPSDRIYIGEDEIRKIIMGENLFLATDGEFDFEDDFVEKNRVSMSSVFKSKHVVQEYLKSLGNTIQSFIEQCNTICYDKYSRKYDLAKAITLIQGFSRYGYKSKEFSGHRVLLSFNMGSREDNANERIAINNYSCMYRYDSMSNEIPDGFVARYRDDDNDIEKIDAEYFSNGNNTKINKPGVILPGDECKLGFSTRTGGNIAFDKLRQSEQSAAKVLESNIVETVRMINSKAYDRQNDRYDLIKAVEEWKKEIAELNKKCVGTPLWPAIKIFGKDLKDIDIFEDKNGRKLLRIEGVLYKPETNWADFVNGDLSKLQKYNELKAPDADKNSEQQIKGTANSALSKGVKPKSAEANHEFKRCTCISAEGNANLNDGRILTLKQMGMENDLFIDLSKFDKIANIEKGSFTKANKLVVLPENFFLPERQNITYRYIADDAFDNDTVVLNAKEFNAFRKDNDINNVDAWIKGKNSIRDLKEWRNTHNTDYDDYVKNRKVMASSAMLLDGDGLSLSEFQERYLASGAKIKEDKHKAVLRNNEVLAAEWLVTKLKQNQKTVLDSVRERVEDTNTNGESSASGLYEEIADYLRGMDVPDILNRINSNKENQIIVKESLLKDCPDWNRISEIVKGADWENIGESGYIINGFDFSGIAEGAFEQQETTTIIDSVRHIEDLMKEVNDLKKANQKNAAAISEVLFGIEKELSNSIENMKDINASQKTYLSWLIGRKNQLPNEEKLQENKARVGKSEENTKEFIKLIKKIKCESSNDAEEQGRLSEQIASLTSGLSDESKELLKKLEAVYMELSNDMLVPAIVSAVSEIFYGEKSSEEINKSVSTLEASVKAFNFNSDMNALFAELDNSDASYDIIIQHAKDLSDKLDSLESKNVKNIIELSNEIGSMVNKLTSEEEKRDLAEKNLEFLKEQLRNIIYGYNDVEAEKKKNEIIGSFNAQKGYDDAKEALLASIDSNEFNEKLEAYITASKNENLDMNSKAVGEAVSKLNSRYADNEIGQRIENAELLDKNKKQLLSEYKEKAYQSLKEDIKNILEEKSHGVYNEFVAEISKDIAEKVELNKKFEAYMGNLKAIEASKSKEDQKSSANIDTVASLVEGLDKDKQEALLKLAGELANVYSDLKAENIREFAENVFSSGDEGVDKDKLEEILSKSNSAVNEANSKVKAALDKFSELLLNNQPKIDGLDGVTAEAEAIVKMIKGFSDSGIEIRFKDTAEKISEELTANKQENSEIDELFAENNDILKEKSDELRERIKSETDKLFTNGLLKHVSDGLNTGNIENAYNSAVEAVRENIESLKKQLSDENTKARNDKEAQQKADGFVQRLKEARKGETVKIVEENMDSRLNSLADIYLSEHANVEGIGRELLTEFVKDVYLDKDGLDARLDKIEKLADIESRRANHELEKISGEISKKAKDSASSATDIVNDIKSLRAMFDKYNTDEIEIKEELKDTIERIESAEKAFDDQNKRLDEAFDKTNLISENKTPIKNSFLRAVETKLKTEILNEQLEAGSSEIINNLESMITQAEENQIKTKQTELIEAVNGELSERAKDKYELESIKDNVSKIVQEKNVKPNRADAIMKAAELYANQDSQLPKNAFSEFIEKAADGDFSRDDISENQLSLEMKQLEEAAKIKEHEEARLAILEIEEAIKNGRPLDSIKELAEKLIKLAGDYGLNQNYAQLSQKINDSISKHEKALEDVISNSEYLEAMANEIEERRKELEKQRERERDKEGNGLISSIGNAINALLGRKTDENEPDLDAEREKNAEDRKALEERWQKEDREFKERIKDEYIKAVDELKRSPEDEAARDALTKCLSEFGEEKKEFLIQAGNLAADRNSDIQPEQLSGILDEVMSGESLRKGAVPEKAEQMLEELKEASHIKENSMLEMAVEETLTFMKEKHTKEEVDDIIERFDMFASALEGKSSSKYQDMKDALTKSRESIQSQDDAISKNIARFDEFTTKQASEEKTAVSAELQSILLADYRDMVECALSFKKYEGTDKYKDVFDNADKVLEKCREEQLNADRDMYKTGFTEYAKAVKNGEEFSADKLDQLLSDIPANRKEALKEVFEIFTDRDSQIEDIGSIEYAVDQALSGSFKSEDIADKNIDGLERLKNDAAIDINKRSREAFEGLLAGCTGDVSRESVTQSIKAAREAASDEKVARKYKESIDIIDNAVNLSENFDKTAIGKLKSFDNRSFINEEDKKALKEEFAKQYAEKIDTVFINNVKYAADKALNGDKNLNSIKYHSECNGMDDVNKAVESRISKLKDEYDDKSFESLVSVLRETKSVDDYGKVKNAVGEFTRRASASVKYSPIIAEENELLFTATEEFLEKSGRINELLRALGDDIPEQAGRIAEYRKDDVMMSANENYMDSLISLVNRRLTSDKKINGIKRKYDGEKAVSDIKVIADKNREVGIVCDNFGKAAIESTSKDEIYKNAEALGRLVKEAAEHEIPLKASYVSADRLYGSVIKTAKERDKQDAEFLKQYINSDNAYIKDAAGEFGNAADKLRSSELIDAVKEAGGEQTSGRDYTAEINVMRKNFEDRCQRILYADEIVGEAFMAIDNVRTKGIDANDKDLTDARNAADELTKGMNEAERQYVQTIAQIAQDEFAPDDVVNKIKKDCVKVISGVGLPENSDDLIKAYEQEVKENKKKERQAEFIALFSDLAPREGEKVLEDYQNRVSQAVAVYKRRDSEGPGYKFLDKFESDVKAFSQAINERYEQEIERAQEGGNKKLHIVEIKTAEGTKTEKYIDAEGGAFFDGVKYKGGIEEKALDKLREQLAYLNGENAGKYYELENESIDTDISYAKMRNTLPVLKDRTVGKVGKKLANTAEYMIPGLSPEGFEIKEKIKNEKDGISRIDKTAVKKSDKAAAKSAKKPQEKQKVGKNTQSSQSVNLKKTRDDQPKATRLDEKKDVRRPKSAENRKSIMFEELKMEFESKGRSKSAGYENNVTPKLQPNDKTNNKKSSEM